MRKKIGRKIYDTEKSKYIGKNVEGEFGNPYGFEEELYKKNAGDFFLLVQGGAESQYSEEDIIPLELEDAKEWIVRVCGDETLKEVVTEKDEKTLEKKSAKKDTSAKKSTSASSKNAKKTSKKTSEK